MPADSCPESSGASPWRSPHEAVSWPASFPYAPPAALRSCLQRARRPHPRNQAISSTLRRLSQYPERRCRRRCWPKCAPMSARGAAYLDSSAFVKLVVAEPESSALREWLRNWPDRASAAVLRVESIRAVAPTGPQAIRTARWQLARLHLIELNRSLLDRASTLPGSLRSLD